MIVGGDAGDDESNIQIVNDEAIACLEVYKGLNPFFFIESDTVTYESAVQDFVDGKIVFTIATTDVPGTALWKYSSVFAARRASSSVIPSESSAGSPSSVPSPRSSF